MKTSIRYLHSWYFTGKNKSEHIIEDYVARFKYGSVIKKKKVLLLLTLLWKEAITPFVSELKFWPGQNTIHILAQLLCRWGKKSMNTVYEIHKEQHKNIRAMRDTWYKRALKHIKKHWRKMFCTQILAIILSNFSACI